MKFFLVIILINLVQLIVFCNADEHSFGKRHENSDYYKIREKILIDDINVTPRNYVILFKYFASYYNPVTYMEIDSPSIGSIERFRRTETAPYLNIDVVTLNFNVTIYINNTLNVQAKLTMYGFGTKPLAPLVDDLVLDTTKSFTVIYVKNANSTQKLFAQNSIGKRQKGDKLIYFESRNVTNTSRFPSRAFEYLGGEFLTYVGFSFNSPTAMVMVNTSFIGEREFNAVVYDMNTEHFVANMSVYGITSPQKGSDFLALI